jgi:methionine-rich copper-binding protein CopC
MTKSFRSCAALCATLMLSPLPALAHAHLDDASPAVGSTISQPPKEVAIWFTEALEPKFSSIEVRDSKGAAMQVGSATVDADNRAALRVALKPLPPGTYKVIWRVLSVDTHRTQGSFTFCVGP